MREAVALVRASWLSATSYRLSTVLSLFSLIVTVVPLYFVAGALQPFMADAIATEGTHYFAFLLIGMISFSFLSHAVGAVPGAIGGGIKTGTFEALLSTPTRLPYLLGGMTGYGYLWTGIRAALLLAAGVVLGAQFAWDRTLIAAGILLLIVLVHIPFGLIAASMMLAFRTTARVPAVVLGMSGLLGGVYYPTHVIPSWIEYFADAIPLSYGLRALRRVFLEGWAVTHPQVMTDLAILLAFIVVLWALGAWMFSVAMRYARRMGTLAQY